MCALPAGFWLPNDHDDGESPPGILADAIDPATGELESIARGLEPTDASVLAALSIVRGSGSAVQDVGQRFQDLRILDTGAGSYIDGEARRALKRLADARQIEIRKVEPAIGDDWAEVRVEYANTARGAALTASVPLRRA